MFDRFSPLARDVMQSARQNALEFRHDHIGPDHVLLGIVATDGTATTALHALGIAPERVRAAVRADLRPGRHPDTGAVPFSRPGKHVLEHALEEAQSAGDGHIATGHLLLGVLRERKSVAARALARLGLRIDGLRPAVQAALRASTDVRDGPPHLAR